MVNLFSRKYTLLKQVLCLLLIPRKKLYKGTKELCDISKAFTPQKLEFMRAGGSYAIVFGKKLQTFAAKTLGVDPPPVYALSKEIYQRTMPDSS